MTEGNRYLKLEFNAAEENIAIARLAAALFGGKRGLSFNDTEELKVAVSEAVSNAVIHGYGGDESRVVEMTLTADAAELTVTVKDTGIGIADPKKALEPTFSSVSDRMGLGFVFMSSFTDGLTVDSAPGQGTTVTMRKHLPE